MTKTGEKTEKQVVVDYDVVSEFAGHQENRGVPLREASRDINTKVKQKAMQVAVAGSFIQYDTIDELEDKLSNAVDEGYTIRVYDEDIGG